MIYRKLESSEKLYLVMHQKGLGVMECPNEDVGVVFETDSLEEAKGIANKFYLENSTGKERRSGWVMNNFLVCVNTYTEEGKRLLAEFQGKQKTENNQRLHKAKNNPNFIPPKDWLGNEISVGDIVLDVTFCYPSQEIGLITWSGSNWIMGETKKTEEKYVWVVDSEYEITDSLSRTISLNKDVRQKVGIYTMTDSFFNKLSKNQIRCIKGKSDDEKEFFKQYFNLK